jgi:hypothetical protein
MTEQPQTDPTQLLLQILQELKAVKEENATLRKNINEDIPKYVNSEIDNLAKQTADGIKSLGAYIDQLKAAAPAAQPQQQGGMAQAIGKIAESIEKYFSGNANSSGGFAAELAQLNEANIKSMLQLQKLDFQALISERARKLGLPAPAEHVNVT